jgi:hypothetical protein
MPEHPYLQWPVFRRSVVAAFDRSLTLLTKRSKRIDTCGPAGRERASDERHDDQNRRDDGE